jgi:hypothetical protein
MSEIVFSRLRRRVLGLVFVVPKLACLRCPPRYVPGLGRPGEDGVTGEPRDAGDAGEPEDAPVASSLRRPASMLGGGGSIWDS